MYEERAQLYVSDPGIEILGQCERNTSDKPSGWVDSAKSRTRGKT